MSGEGSAAEQDSGEQELCPSSVEIAPKPSRVLRGPEWKDLHSKRTHHHLGRAREDQSGRNHWLMAPHSHQQHCWTLQYACVCSTKGWNQNAPKNNALMIDTRRNTAFWKAHGKHSTLGLSPKNKVAGPQPHIRRHHIYIYILCGWFIVMLMFQYVPRSLFAAIFQNKLPTLHLENLTCTHRCSKRQLRSLCTYYSFIAILNWYKVVPPSQWVYNPPTVNPISVNINQIGHL